jgi:glycosyltransferase involved in cell wall biosynthesis
LVCPDAQRTETVGQTLALARLWSREYRVHILLLSPEGPLLTAFRTHAVAVWQPDQTTDPAAFADAAVTAILAETALAFAVTVSGDARAALIPLQRARVPHLALVSELASRCSPINAVSETMAWADQVALPARMVLADAMATDYLLSPGRDVHVVPPGDCDVMPDRPVTETEVARLRTLLRPEGIGQRRFIVLGAGPVAYASGVDVFLDIARDVVGRHEGRDAVFVWAGPGFDLRNGGYGADVRTQLYSAGLENHVIFLPETPAMVALYQLADLFVIPARADPVSSNGIAAMRSGLPVLCFEGSSGLAEHLASVGLARSCVAGYLDVGGLADRITALAAAPARRAILAAHSASLAAHLFDPQTQADTIASMAAAGRSDTPAEAEAEADIATICASPNFDPKFFSGFNADIIDRRAAAQKYVTAVRKGIAIRKPEPGFHPLMFAQSHFSMCDRDPYAAFLRLDRPTGPWSVPVIQGQAEAPNADISQISLRAALHIHAYFTDQLPNIVVRLACNLARPDLYVSVADAAGRKMATQCLEAYQGKVRAIEVVPNIGRDIGPLLTAFGPELVTNYDVVGHIHTKKTSHADDLDMVRRWVELTLSGVLGGPKAGPMMDRVLMRFATDAKLGVVHPEDPHVFGWTANLAPARRLVAAMGRGPLPEAFNFPVGTMFWMRAAALQPFIDLGLTWEAYPAEPLATDGTSLHALERLFGVVPRLDGWQAAVTFTPGIGR